MLHRSHPEKKDDETRALGEWKRNTTEGHGNCHLQGSGEAEVDLEQADLEDLTPNQ